MRCNCGNELPESANFCNKCGMKVSKSGLPRHTPTDSFVSKDEYDKLFKRVQQLTVRVKKLEIGLDKLVPED